MNEVGKHAAGVRDVAVATGGGESEDYAAVPAIREFWFDGPREVGPMPRSNPAAAFEVEVTLSCRELSL